MAKDLVTDEDEVVDLNQELGKLVKVEHKDVLAALNDLCFTFRKIELVLEYKALIAREQLMILQEDELEEDERNT